MGPPIANVVIRNPISFHRHVALTSPGERSVLGQVLKSRVTGDVEFGPRRSGHFSDTALPGKSAI
jgi:hypothetical protein